MKVLITNAWGRMTLPRRPFLSSMQTPSPRAVTRFKSSYSVRAYRSCEAASPTRWCPWAGHRCVRSCQERRSCTSRSMFERLVLGPVGFLSRI